MNIIYKSARAANSIVKTITMFCLVLLVGTSAFAQPQNDDPCNALFLNVSNVCNFQTFSNQDATGSPGVPAPNCSNYQDDDIWFQVLVPAGGAITIQTEAQQITDGAIALYTGTCNSLTEIACDDDSGPGFMPELTVGGLQPNSILYIRFFTWNGSGEGTFGICAVIPPPPPANDECSGAIPLTVNPDLNCGVVTAGTTTSATNSTSAPAPTCGAAGTNDDVWFSFVATGSVHSISLLNVTGSSTDMAMSLYSGANCGALTHLQCSDPNEMVVGGLTAGDTYYVRVWTWTSTSTSSASFNICIGTPPPPPANDECTGAVQLTVNPDLNCGVVTAGSTISSTGSTSVPAPSCGAFGANDDVWFSFVATSAQHVVSLLNVTGATTDMVMALYEGASCGSLNQLSCSDPNTMIVGGLTIGNTYYVRVWTWSSSAASTASFDICIGTPPPPPPFDEPCSPIFLNVNEGGECLLQEFNTTSATGTGNVPAPGCANYNGGDIWFNFVVPCAGSVIISTSQGTVTDGGMALYSGTCDNLTQIDCNDDGGPGLMPQISASNLTPGDTLWVRFWEYGNDVQGTFSICVYMPPPPPPAATCATAQSFCTSTTPTTVPNITGQPSIGGSGAYGCLFTVPNPTFYYLQIQNSGSISIQISQTSTTGTGLDVDFIVWGPFTSLDAACVGIDATSIVDCSYSIAAVEVADIPNAQAGEFYLFLVTNFSDQPGSITYQQIGGTGSSDCSLVCSLDATNSGPACAGGTVDLTASTVPNATYTWTGPSCFTSTDQNPMNVPVPTVPGTYTYTVTATGPNGIRCTDTTRVTVIASPNLGADSTFLICEDGTVDLTAVYNTTDLSVSWTYNSQNVGNPSAVSAAGVYEIIAINTVGCADTAQVTVNVNTINLTASVVQTACQQIGTITATVQEGISPFNYTISSDPGNPQTSNEFTVNTEGAYTITVTDSLQCTAQAAIDVVFIPPFSVEAGNDVSIFSAETTQLVAVANQQPTGVLWTPALGLSATNVLNPVASPEETTTYTVEVTSAEGCLATDNVTVTVVPICINLRNAFTPNGDGINDFFLVYNSFNCLSKVTINVFNRYGNKVYESKDYRNNWDGTYKGKPVPDGTYYAVVDYYLINGKKITRKTDLTILRAN
jgi:gliding motility-associated-like protein